MFVAVILVIWHGLSAKLTVVELILTNELELKTIVN